MTWLLIIVWIIIGTAFFAFSVWAFGRAVLRMISQGAGAYAGSVTDHTLLLKTDR